MQTRRYTKEDVTNNLFYQLPKFLFEGELKNLSNDARVLYSLLKDRHELSLSNGWVNDTGEVYFIFSRENMGEILGLSKKTVIKAVNDLKKYDLIEEERRGQGKPNLIFLRLVSVNNTKKCKNSTSRNVKIPPHEVGNLHPNNTNTNNTDINNSQSISPSKQSNIKPRQEEKTDGQTNNQTNDDVVDEQEVQEIITQSQLHLYEDIDLQTNIKDTIKQAHKNTSTRATIKKLKLEHIDIAISKYKQAQEQQDIKNPKMYFKKCLISAIEEFGLKKLF